MTSWDELTSTFRAFDKATESIRKILEALDRTRDLHFQNKLDFSNKLLESLQTPSSQYQQLLEQMNRIGSMIPHDATTEIAEGLNKLTQINYSPLQEITESLNKTQTILNFDHLFKEKLISEIERVAETINFKQLTIDQYGTITLGQEKAAAGEVAETIERFSKILEIYKPTEATSELLDFISGLKKPLRAVIIFIFKQILLPFIVSALASIYAPQIKTFIKPYADQNFTNRQIQQKARGEFGDEILDGMAFVTADKLNVREHPTRKSNIITEICKGQVITVVEKRRRWKLVSFEDEETGEFITGWVFSRYTHKLYK